MADSTRVPEWFNPIVVGTGVVSAVASIVALTEDLIPTGPAAIVVGVLAAAIALVLSFALRCGRLLRWQLGTVERSVSWVGLLLCVTTVLVVGVKLGALVVAGRSPLKAEVATAAEREQPYPVMLVTRDMGGLYEMNKTPASSQGPLAIQYYVVSDSEFWRTLYDKDSVLTVDEVRDFQQNFEEWANSPDYQGGDQAEDLNSSDFTLVETLLDRGTSAVVSNDVVRFGSFVWTKYLRDRRPVGKLKSGVRSLQQRVGFDQRLKHETVSDYEDIVWYDAPNQTLLADGWLALDPLSAELVKANAELEEPIVKAGGIKWEDANYCGEEEGGDTYEYAFVVPRAIQLVVLDVENTSDEPLNSVALEYGQGKLAQEGVYKLRPTLEVPGETAQRVYRVPGGLDPGEHLLMIVGVRVGPFETSADYDPTAGEALGFVGPSAPARTVTVNGETSDVRPFNEQGLSYIYVGYEGGSCPEVWTWGEGIGRWVKERNVLVGADGPEKARTERQSLKRFDGRILVRERERETSHLDEMTLVARDANGREVRLPPDRSELAERDGVSLDFDYREDVVVRFPGWREDLTDPHLVVDGYYVPYDPEAKRAE